MNYLPNTDEQRRAMLDTLGLSSVEDLFREIPEKLRETALHIKASLDPISLEKHLREIGSGNTASRELCFLGGGAYDRYTPALLDELICRSEFYTAYTPYQAEISQGTLIAIFEFQTMMAELYGLDMANASLYDGPNALWEAVSIAYRLHEKERRVVLAAGDLNPRALDVIRSYAKNLGLLIETIPLLDGGADLDFGIKADLSRVACVVAQNPGYYGRVQDFTALFAKASEQGAVPILYADPLSLGILKTPGKMGAEIAVGEGQSLGLPLGFGGPYLGIMAAAKKHMRRVPGRLAGETLDADGKRGFILTLQAREQHIKREKATSSVCTNQALCALSASIYLTTLGPVGLEEVAKANVKRAAALKGLLAEIRGISFPHQGPVFNEFVFRTPLQIPEFLLRMREKGILAGIETPEGILTAVTEKRTPDEIALYAKTAKEILSK